MQRISGTHIWGDFASSCRDRLLSTETVMYIHKIIAEAGFSIRDIAIHEFEGGGYSFCFVLAESHLNMHTWPEEGVVQVDLSTCNYSRNNHQASIDAIRKILDLFEATDSILCIDDTISIVPFLYTPT